jgi:hypothetical protein
VFLWVQLDVAIENFTRALQPPIDAWQEAGLSVKRSLAFSRRVGATFTWNGLWRHHSSTQGVTT